MRARPRGMRLSGKFRRPGSKMKRGALLSPYSLLVTWKGDRSVPSHVMLKLLRRLREHYSKMMKAPLPPARLQRAQDTLGEIWAGLSGTGASIPPGGWSRLSFGWPGIIWSRAGRGPIGSRPTTIECSDVTIWRQGARRSVRTNRRPQSLR